MTARIPFILDCDPGHDDALALVVGLARPELELLAVTTVAGNAGLDATTRNALRLLTLVNRPDIPMATDAAERRRRGHDRPASIHRRPDRGGRRGGKVIRKRTGLV